MKNFYSLASRSALSRWLFPSLLILFILIAPSINCVYGQDATKFKHSGVVVDNEGNPIVGATVFEEASSRGTITDYNGAYELYLATKTADIKCTYIGFVTASKKSDSQKSSTISMVVDDINIEDIVVVGYGTSRKADLTGSVSRITAEEFETQQISSLEEAMVGRMAGVTVMPTDSEPGADISISIRGAGSFNASNSPLYVVDGVSMESSDVVISPSEIKSIDVLKDASSTAIYGSEGANGVVIITTNRAEAGSTKITYSGSASIQTPIRLYDMMNAEQFAKHTLFGQVLIGSTTSTYVDPDGYEFVYGNGTNNDTYDLCMDVLEGRNTNDNNWQELLFRNSIIQSHKFGVTSADTKTRYALTGTYYSQTGIIPNSDYTLITVRANAERDVAKWLTTGTNVSAGVKSGKKIATSYIRSLLQRNPIMEYSEINYDENDFDEEEIDSFSMESKYLSTYKSTTATVKSWLQFKFTDYLRLDVSGSYGYTLGKTEKYVPSESATSVNGYATSAISEKVNYLNDNLLYITPKRMGDHSVDALLGFSYKGSNSYSLSATNQDFDIEDLEVYDMSVGSVSTIAKNSYSFWSMVSSFARFNYQYKGRYLFTGTFRADGVTKFYPGNKWGYFPSGAFAWRASDEKFIKNLNIFSNLKVRASMGVSGNHSIGVYQTLSLLNTSYYAMSGSESEPAFQIIRPENTDLQWETSHQYDLGIDMGFLKNKISATIDIYHKRTRDMLLNETVPTFSGYSSAWTNRGILDNRGAELTLNTVIFNKRKFKWSTSFNIYLNRSNVVYVSESGEYNYGGWVNGANNNYMMVEGQPVGLFYGLNYQGVYASQQEVIDSGISSVFSVATRPGYPKFEDVNEDGVIDAYDRKVIGCAEAKFQGGFSSNLTYKNIQLNMIFDYRYGGDVWNATLTGIDNKTYWYTNKSAALAEQGYYPTLFEASTGELYSVGNEDTAYQHVPYTYKDPSTTHCSSLYLEDGSYLRLASVTLSYTIPSKITNKFHISKFNIYCNVKNAFILTGYSGYSPIVNSGSNVLTPSVDNAAYPITRNYTLGVNITL